MTRVFAARLRVGGDTYTITVAGGQTDGRFRCEKVGADLEG
jgi:hypothetical protein